MKNSKKRTVFSIIFAVFVLLGVIAYLLADRYLIQHVEIAVVEQPSVVSAQALTEEELISMIKGDTAQVSSDEESVEVETVVSVESTSVVTVEPSITVSDSEWTYQRDGVSIVIDKVVRGSGQDQVTYFVADVVLDNATELRNAFAQNMFGTNIIEYTSDIAQDNNAVFAINGDYYGFRQDGIIIRNGVIYRDVAARVGLAFYLDGSMKIYDETQTTAEQLLADGVWNTLSFGPALIQDSVVVDDFGRVSIDKNIGNHSIQGNNPRTGIGVIDENHFIFVVVDGRSSGYSRGVTLDEFAQIFQELGCTDAYNIDGGGSSTMVFLGEVINNPLGKNKERGTSDILYIGL